MVRNFEWLFTKPLFKSFMQPAYAFNIKKVHNNNCVVIINVVY